MDEQASFEPQAVLAKRRGGWARIALVVPVLALAATAWIGISGKQAAPEQVADARTAATVAPAAVHEAPPALIPALHPAPPFPSTVLGLEVRNLQDLDRGVLEGDAVVAIVGWYAPRPELGCPRSDDGGQATVDSNFDPDHGVITQLGVDADIRTFCDRSGVLFATPNAALLAASAGTPDHPPAKGTIPAITAMLTPGVSVPPELESAAGGITEVVLVGRILQFSQWTHQAISGRELVVDRVVWVDGVGRTETTSILPSLLDHGQGLSYLPREQLADAVVGPTGGLLMETLVDAKTLTAVDPAAASVVGSTAPAAVRIWYRRALGPDPALDAPRWIAIDDSTGEVIASGALGFDRT